MITTIVSILKVANVSMFKITVLLNP